MIGNDWKGLKKLARQVVLGRQRLKQAQHTVTKERSQSERRRFTKVLHKESLIPYCPLQAAMPQATLSGLYVAARCRNHHAAAKGQKPRVNRLSQKRLLIEGH